MRKPYHPLTQQTVNSSDENKELTEDEKRETVEIFLRFFFLSFLGLRFHFSFS
ncbi:hypothetical protein IQ508_000755 [Salmonella enterica]|nr:hypothetical protein [Salmonella enterica]EGL4564797.1 hypothetical protein [Salmonella enterica]EGL4582790.1 hypothetical protein [Salmonella enterica]EGL4632015.1 hypothetical protein [Salmonella enterica]EGL4649909.1 hypothetical protein [Salmonella enterica]